MARIYLDSNVFSNLRNPKDTSHKLLGELLEQYKDNISLHFSHAHIRDKKKDMTDFKFEDFKYMESLVQDNYLSYHLIKQTSSFYLATPKMVFDEEVDNSLDELLSFFEPDENDETKLNAFKTYLSSALDMKEVKVEQIMIESGIQKEVIDTIFNGKENNPTLLDITKVVTNLSKNIISDGLTYKNLRILIDSGLGQELDDVKQDKIGLNEAFKDSFFQKTFVEFIKDSIHVKDKTKIPYYDFYMLSYQTLDMLGISKDKLKKNNGFGNILNDALHSYYARYCDVLVTNDKGLRDKSTILYSMYEASTLIVSVEEFVALLPEIGLDTDASTEHFFAKLNYDIQHAGRKLHKSLEAGIEILRLLETSVYFNYFDAILEVTLEKSQKYILCKSDTSYLSEPNYREIGKIINRLVNLFGGDSDGRAYFDFAKEISGKSVFIERKWDFEYVQVFLGIEPFTRKFSLSLIFLTS